MEALVSRSSWALLGVNLGVIGLAVTQDWSLATVLASYWLQSIIIGLFQAQKMADLTVFSTEGVKMNDVPVQPTVATKRGMVAFFLVHYGFFHLVYAMFIVQYGAIAWGDVALSGLAFFANHLFSYLDNRGRVRKVPPNIGTMMAFPYIRILPMHAFIIGGALLAATGGWAIALFMALKTIADEAMHIIEHRDAAES
ncbi:DUF6498-containing protein [Undibacter mobilis]|uniref:Uncharacterized protein n=1 Tax=Undibacter mobilis TaxID=2292256 RepID=A0A371B0K5_9BRAD|nr:DUF6498-containing protein [Undibacter mobilis]RDV01105.1 hypothetical protein DXH78_17860 [Undibacter mobilis]